MDLQEYRPATSPAAADELRDHLRRIGLDVEPSEDEVFRVIGKNAEAVIHGVKKIGRNVDVDYNWLFGSGPPLEVGMSVKSFQYAAKKIAQDLMKEDVLREIVRQELIRERNIGSVIGDVTVKVSIDLTKHADERRFRHGNQAEITEDEIVSLVENSTDRIIDYILMDRLDVGETVVLRHQGRNLNVVGALEQGPRPDVLELTVITVMRKEDFKPKPKDTVINIR